MEATLRAKAMIDYRFVIRATLLTGFGLGLYIGSVFTILAFVVF